MLVVAGNQPTQHLTRSLLAWLRRLDRHGTLLGADRHRRLRAGRGRPARRLPVTLHWEAVQLFHEHHPEIEVVEQLFLSDRNRLTCAGGIATLDLMLELIRTKHGHDLAEVVRTGLVHERQRSRLRAAARPRSAATSPRSTAASPASSPTWRPISTSPCRRASSPPAPASRSASSSA